MPSGACGALVNESIIIIIIIITKTIFIVLSSWQSHCESSLGSRDEYRNGARWTKPIGWNRRPAYRPPVNRIHHRRLLVSSEKHHLRLMPETIATA